MGIISTGPGGALAYSSASGGKIYAYNAITTIQINAAPRNPSRQKITFHNPSSVDIFIFPEFVVNTGRNVNLDPSTVLLGGCFRVYGNGGTLSIEGECQGSWGVFAADSSGNASLTVMDSNV